MTTVCAIYGYEFTREFSQQGMRFVPRYTGVADAHDKARDLGRYNLTGVVIIDEYDDHQIFCLEAVLSFIEHLDVLISDPMPLTDSDVFAPFTSVARTAKRHNGGGAVLHQDAYFHDIRSSFIGIAMSKPADDQFCKATGWKTLFFKATAPFRQRSPYIEVSYFLRFSGLETYVRRTLGDLDSRDVARLISRRLRQLGFDIYPYRSDDLKRSADTYARLRNALFHNSSFETTRRNKKGVVVNYKLLDYYANFLILVNLVVLRGSGFSHPSINWDSWITMQQ
jgi:hypothetical protein